MPIEPQVKVYTPDEVVVSFGSIIIKGCAESECTRYVLQEDDTSDKTRTKKSV